MYLLGLQNVKGLQRILLCSNKSLAINSVVMLCPAHADSVEQRVARILLLYLGYTENTGRRDNGEEEETEECVCARVCVF